MFSKSYLIVEQLAPLEALVRCGEERLWITAGASPRQGVAPGISASPAEAVDRVLQVEIVEKCREMIVFTGILRSAHLVLPRNCSLVVVVVVRLFSARTMSMLRFNVVNL